MSTPELKLVKPSLEALAKEWLDTKAAEDALRDRRIRIEEEMAQQMPIKEEGAITEQTDHYKVTATARLTRSMDWSAWGKVADSIPEHLRPVRYKPELDARGVKYLEQNEPDIYRQIAQCMTVKPAKTGFTVKPLEA